MDNNENEEVMENVDSKNAETGNVLPAPAPKNFLVPSDQKTSSSERLSLVKNF